MAERIGVSRVYGAPMGLPSVAGDPESPPARGVYANILELQNPSEADAFFDYVASAEGGPEAQLSAVEAPFALGERAMVGNYSVARPGGGRDATTSSSSSSEPTI